MISAVKFKALPCGIFLISLCAATLAHGAYVGAGSSVAAEGGWVVPVVIEPREGEVVSGVQFDLTYDAESFVFLSARPGESATSAAKQIHHQVFRPGHMRVIVAGLNQNVIPEGSIADFTFAEKTGKSGIESVSIHLTRVILSDPYGYSVPLTAPAGPAMLTDSSAAAAALPSSTSASGAGSYISRTKAGAIVMLATLLLGGAFLGTAQRTKKTRRLRKNS